MSVVKRGVLFWVTMAQGKERWMDGSSGREGGVEHGKEEGRGGVSTAQVSAERSNVTRKEQTMATTRTGNSGWVGHATWTCDGKKMNYGRKWANARTMYGVDYLHLQGDVTLEVQHLVDGRERMAVLVGMDERETLVCSKEDARKAWKELRKFISLGCMEEAEFAQRELAELHSA
jgi:hypothetical protein